MNEQTQKQVEQKLNEQKNNFDLKKPTTPTTFRELMTSMELQIKKALPKHIPFERFIRIINTAFSANPELKKCTSFSILGGAMLGAQMGLEINSPLGQAYLIPYKNKKTGLLEAQFQIGYQGQLELAYRTNLYYPFFLGIVYKDDLFDYEYGLKPFLRHKPCDNPTDDPIFYYAKYTLRNGGEGFYVMSRSQIVNYAKKWVPGYCNNNYYGGWKIDFDSQALKTVLKRLLKYSPKTVELYRWLTQDQVVKNEIDENMDTVSNNFEYLDMAEVDNGKDIN